MDHPYIVSEWAEVRRRELVELPDEIQIYTDFLGYFAKEEVEAAFRSIWHLFDRIFGDIAQHPEAFSMPLYQCEEHRYLSDEAREARTADKFQFHQWPGTAKTSRYSIRRANGAFPQRYKRFLFCSLHLHAFDSPARLTETWL